MAFSTAIISKNADEVPERVGRKRVVFGTFTNTAASTGGEVATGLDRIEYMSTQLTGAAVGAAEASINETFPFEGGTATLVTSADVDGIWMAWGI